MLRLCPWETTSTCSLSLPAQLSQCSLEQHCGYQDLLNCIAQEPDRRRRAQGLEQNHHQQLRPRVGEEGAAPGCAPGAPGGGGQR